MIGDEHVTAPLSCPGCARSLDCHMDGTDAGKTPGPGAVSLCAYCSTVSLYVVVNGELALRLPTDVELDALLRDEGLQRGIALVRQLRERR